MSVLIKGLKMPKEKALKVAIRDGIASVYLDEGKADYYSVIELPDHGDLIDREETAHEMWMKECYECNRVYDNNGCKGCAVTRMINVIACAETAPTVIPAERSEG